MIGLPSVHYHSKIYHDPMQGTESFVAHESGNMSHKGRWYPWLSHKRNDGLDP